MAARFFCYAGGVAWFASSALDQRIFRNMDPPQRSEFASATPMRVRECRAEGKPPAS
jgi:hypothetical protein